MTSLGLEGKIKRGTLDYRVSRTKWVHEVLQWEESSHKHTGSIWKTAPNYRRYWDKVKGKERRSKEWSWQQVKLAVKWNYGKAIESYNCAEELSVYLTMIVMCQPNLKAKCKLRTKVYFLLTWWWLQPWWNQPSWFKEMKCGYTVWKKWRMSILEFLAVRHIKTVLLYTLNYL